MQRMMEELAKSTERSLATYRLITMEDTDMNNLSAIKRKLNAFRIRLEARDFRNPAEEAVLRAKAEELYERCKEIAPEEVAEYERLVRSEIRRKAKKDVKRAMRHGR